MVPAPSTATPKYMRRFDTLAQHMLDPEAKVDVVPDTKYQLLDDILADMKSRVAFDPTVMDPDSDRRQALRALQTIDEVLTDHNVIYPPSDWIVTLAEGLQPQSLTTDGDFTAALALAHCATPLEAVGYRRKKRDGPKTHVAHRAA